MVIYIHMQYYLLYLNYFFFGVRKTVIAKHSMAIANINDQVITFPWLVEGQEGVSAVWISPK